MCNVEMDSVRPELQCAQEDPGRAYQLAHRIHVLHHSRHQTLQPRVTTLSLMVDVSSHVLMDITPRVQQFVLSLCGTTQRLANLTTVRVIPTSNIFSQARAVKVQPRERHVRLSVTLDLLPRVHRCVLRERGSLVRSVRLRDARTLILHM